jgi:L-threonylcarbamoyladenylate synthase
MDEFHDMNKTVSVLRAGGTILYPTDTIWGIGCDATNSKAVNKIYRIKVRDRSKSLIVLVESLEALSDYVEEIPGIALDLIEMIREPLTIIYPRAKNLARNALADDGSVGIRIPANRYCQALLKAFGKPITSTSANISGDPSPLTFGKIPQKIKDMVDYVADIQLQTLMTPKPSTIIKITAGGEMEIIRS